MYFRCSLGMFIRFVHSLVRSFCLFGLQRTQKCYLNLSTELSHFIESRLLRVFCAWLFFRSVFVCVLNFGFVLLRTFFAFLNFFFGFLILSKKARDTFLCKKLVRSDSGNIYLRYVLAIYSLRRPSISFNFYDFVFSFETIKANLKVFFFVFC